MVAPNGLPLIYGARKYSMSCAHILPANDLLFNLDGFHN